jgi:2-amino-4-hydroxy-6-hydroxymethyldihydropteridine diphosphokinase
MSVTSCAIGLGSNLGDSRLLLDLAIKSLADHPQIELMQVAGYYCTKPIGPPQPDYLNSAVTIATSLSPWDLLAVLQSIENNSGRERQVHWGARTLDLDLLLYGCWYINTSSLQVPHPTWPIGGLCWCLWPKLLGIGGVEGSRYRICGWRSIELGLY